MIGATERLPNDLDGIIPPGTAARLAVQLNRRLNPNLRDGLDLKIAKRKGSSSSLKLRRYLERGGRPVRMNIHESTALRFKKHVVVIDGVRVMGAVVLAVQKLAAVGSRDHPSKVENDVNDLVQLLEFVHANHGQIPEDAQKIICEAERKVGQEKLLRTLWEHAREFGKEDRLRRLLVDVGLERLVVDAS